MQSPQHVSRPVPFGTRRDLHPTVQPEGHKTKGSYLQKGEDRTLCFD